LKEKALDGTLWLEGRIKGMGRRGTRRKQLLDDLKEMGGYCILKEVALDGTLWIEGRIKGMGKRGIRRKQLLGDLMETRG
jgi:cytochrome c